MRPAYHCLSCLFRSSCHTGNRAGRFPFWRYLGLYGFGTALRHPPFYPNKYLGYGWCHCPRCTRGLLHSGMAGENGSSPRAPFHGIGGQPPCGDPIRRLRPCGDARSCSGHTLCFQCAGWRESVGRHSCSGRYDPAFHYQSIHDGITGSAAGIRRCV